MKRFLSSSFVRLASKFNAKSSKLNFIKPVFVVNTRQFTKSAVRRTDTMDDTPIRRLQNLRDTLGNSAPSRVSIGNVETSIEVPADWTKVPPEVLVDLDDQVVLSHLQWIMQKDNLGQDIFLIGPPGPLRRHVALAYCSITQREVEYIVLHRDTSAEADLKQRREIVASASSDGSPLSSLTAEWIDAATIRAALEGRILIIEGVEKAERNVLPVLNNLLENREVSLEDGRHLIHMKMYENLLQQGHTPESLKARQIIPVHPRFRVIALGLPVPPHRGNPLDPPFRSRFQVRWIDGWANVNKGGVVLNQSEVPDLGPVFEKIADLAATISYSHRIDAPLSSTAPTAHLLPSFTQVSLPHLITLLNLFPAESLKQETLESTLDRVYPWLRLVGGLNADQKQVWLEFLQSCQIRPKQKSDLVPKPKKASSLFDFDDAPQSPCSIQVLGSRSPSAYDLIKISRRPSTSSPLNKALDFETVEPNIVLDFAAGDNVTSVLVPGGPTPVHDDVHQDSPVPSSVSRGKIVVTPRLKQNLILMLQAHAAGSDIALLGTRGCGKTSLINEFARLLGYSDGWVEIVHLYKDMTARDLLQRRNTRQDSSTYWENSGLVVSALEGKICVLDGIEALEAGTLASLQRLTQDRTLPLPDGSTLVSQRIFDDLRRVTGASKEQLMNGTYLGKADQNNPNRILPIHPSFRIIATGSTPFAAAQTGTISDRLPWLTEEVGNMFSFIDLGRMDKQEEALIIHELVGDGVPKEKLDKLLLFADKFRQQADGMTTEGNVTGQATALTKGSQFGTRQVVRIASRLARNPNEDLYDAIQRALLAPFLPRLARNSLEELLKQVEIQPTPSTDAVKFLDAPKVSPGVLHLADVKVPIYPVEENDPTGIPYIPSAPAGFFDNPLHTRLLREIAIDYSQGEHLMLLGNQGTGKNRITDRFLELIRRPRGYVQLHRDTTVQSLLVQPTVEAGKIIYKDSPLIECCRHGRILVVDEADKAPTYVVSVLKSLAETGEMTLTDGRRIRPAHFQVSGSSHDRDIILHPDFRLIFLANRAGAGAGPFLGYDINSVMGESFAKFAVENPDVESEMALLRQAAPDVSEEMLRKLVMAFGDLRKAFDEGLVNYPYSLRELLNLTRHLAKYPDDDISEVLRNVFDFDVMKKETHELLLDILNRHNIPVEALGLEAVNASKAKARGRGIPGGQAKGPNGQRLELKFDREPRPLTDPKDGKVDKDNKPHVGGNTWKGGTGGSSTAGLGGRGGFYRFDAGHNVHQLPDHLKNDVPQHVKDAARKMAKEALEKRLQEIGLSSYDARAYKDIYDNVATEIRQLRTTFEGLQAKEKERIWMRNQTDGDLDDSRLVDGLTGEHGIYKRRGSSDPEYGAPQRLPKRLKFVFDVSGSMYRFNGHDQRLNRSLETALLVMESLHSLGNKYKYEIIGHSGDSDKVGFVEYDKPPVNEAERMKVLAKMVSHTQYCMSGDNTLEATKRAIEEITKEEADDYFVIVISDANLRRYGIAPEMLGRIMGSDPKVNCVVIFIGTLGDEAEVLRRRLPTGKSFIALDTADVPRIMQQFLTSVM